MRLTAAIALTARQQQQIVAAFQTQSALSGATAQPLQKLGLRDGKVLRDLIASTVLRKAGPERYFLDQSVWQARRRKARTAPLILAVLVVLAAIMVKTCLAR